MHIPKKSKNSLALGKSGAKYANSIDRRLPFSTLGRFSSPDGAHDLQGLILSGSCPAEKQASPFSPPLKAKVPG